MRNISFFNIMGRKTKMAFFLSLSVMMTVLSACADHNDMYDAGIKVGNILLSNNTLVTPAGYNPETMDAVGVIFYASADTAIAVATIELGDLCFADSIGRIDGTSKDQYSLDGKTSTAALMMSDTFSPAAHACYEYSPKLTGWHLPSAGELRVLSVNLNRVGESMRVISGTGFSDVQYLSSSEDNSSSNSAVINCYCVSLIKGITVSVPKTEKHRVRPVILIH